MLIDKTSIEDTDNTEGKKDSRKTLFVRKGSKTISIFFGSRLGLAGPSFPMHLKLSMATSKTGAADACIPYPFFGELAVSWIFSGERIFDCMQLASETCFKGVCGETDFARLSPGFIVAYFVCSFIVGPLGTNAGQYFRELRIWNLFKGFAVL